MSARTHCLPPVKRVRSEDMEAVAAVRALGGYRPPPRRMARNCPMNTAAGKKQKIPSATFAIPLTSTGSPKAEIHTDSASMIKVPNPMPNTAVSTEQHGNQMGG